MTGPRPSGFHDHRGVWREYAEGRGLSPEPTREVTFGGGHWHWFCLREGCRWSGTGLLSEGGANREADRHDREYHDAV